MRKLLRLVSAAIAACVVGAVASAAILLPTGKADSGNVLDMGDFVHGSVQCGGHTASQGYVPFVSFAGTLNWSTTAVLLVTDDGERPLDASAVRVWVNHIPQTTLLDTTYATVDNLPKGLYYEIPVSDSPTAIGVTVSNTADDEITFSIGKGVRGQFSQLAVGKTNEPVCTTTSNPAP